MKTILRVTRDVTPIECDWLEETVPEGRICFEFTGATYGCIDAGMAVSFQEDGGYPFLEIPLDALERVSTNAV